MNYLFIGSVCLLTLYLLSAIGKTLNLSGSAKYLQSKLKFLPTGLCIFAIVMVIILKIFASSFILYSAYTNKHKRFAYYSVIALILFNILTTLIFHFPPVDKEYINSLKNLAITGGFVLLLDRFNEI